MWIAPQLTTAAAELKPELADLAAPVARAGGSADCVSVKVLPPFALASRVAVTKTWVSSQPNVAAGAGCGAVASTRPVPRPSTRAKVGVDGRAYTDMDGS